MKTNLSFAKAFANCKRTSDCDKFCLFCQQEDFLPQFVNCRTDMDIAIIMTSTTKTIEKNDEGGDFVAEFAEKTISNQKLRKERKKSKKKTKRESKQISKCIRKKGKKKLQKRNKGRGK